MGRKYSRNRSARKRGFWGNRFTKEQSTSYVSTSAKNLGMSSDESIYVDQMHIYRIISFFTVFSAISDLVICKKCKEKINFTQTGARGLGFKIVLKCTCGDNYINSCPLIDTTFEINRRFTLAMRMLGIGRSGINLFCGIMDLCNGFTPILYYNNLEQIYVASKAVCEFFIKRAAEKEKEKITMEEKEKRGSEEEDVKPALELCVSGNGTWKRRGFKSLFGVTSLIGKHSNKILDLVISSSFCATCSSFKGNRKSEEYEIFMAGHKDECSKNHSKNARKMEVNAIQEMFLRSEEKYGVKYTTFIAHGDRETFQHILDRKLYDDVEVNKKECVIHAEKRMGARLRNLKKTISGLGGEGQGMLTDSLILDLTKHYGSAIRKNPDSIENMQRDIWALYYHNKSTDENPQHNYCSLNWCKWLQAKQEGTLADYKHNPLLSTVLKAIKAVYNDLSKKDLLERCTGAYVQNNNESFDSLLWAFVPKHIFCESKIIEIAAYMAAGIFNEGFYSILKIMTTMGVKIGPFAQAETEKRDEERRKIFGRRLLNEARPAKISKIEENPGISESFYEVERGYLYDLGAVD